ncbi:MAG TPA: CAP domain-containing protein [Pyrinomonadaceae bacterium]|nr:CAP domain-containing protein [Pyrinomonadaceae bacterium]
MKPYLAATVFLAFATLITINNSAQTKTQSKTNVTLDALSNPERDLLSEINQARANPQLYASYLEKLKPLFSGKEYTRVGHDPLVTEEGWSAVEDAIKFLKVTKPLPPLRLSQGLYLAAAAHVKDQSSTGSTGHKGTDSTFIEQRVKPFGTWDGGIGENITYGDDSARERILSWLIDDGFPSRGHRRRLLSSDYNVAGISCGAHPQWTAMCVLTLAGGFADVTTAANGNTAVTGNAAAKTTTSAKSKNANVKTSNVKNRKI